MACQGHRDKRMAEANSRGHGSKTRALNHDLPACLSRFDNLDINVLGGLDKCGYKCKVRLNIVPSKHASYSCNRNLVKRSRRIEVARKDSW